MELDLLPDEVLELILWWVSPYQDLESCAQVSTRWRRLASAIRIARKRALRREISHHGGVGLQWAQRPQIDDEAEVVTITKRYSHSAVYDDNGGCMWVFGGCTSSSTTFNDIWKLDLTTRTWSRPIATGTYPSPKACAVMVLHQPANVLLLFGGWTHPSLYPLHQSWRLFNELHVYDLNSNRWTHIMPSSPLKPPSMAGHSATIHNNKLVVFGGLQKQRSSIGQYTSSNDVWCFDLSSYCWEQCDIPEPRPTPRYGQSQLKLDEKHILILGGCGGPNNVFNDIWLLTLEAPHWKWQQCTIENESQGASHMWCHPAVKVENYAIILGKNKNVVRKGSSNSGMAAQAQWNVIPPLQRGINRGQASIRRSHAVNQALRQQRLEQQQHQQQNQHQQSDANNDSRMEEGDDDEASAMDIEVEPVKESKKRSQEHTFKSSVVLNMNQDLRERDSSDCDSTKAKMSLPRQSSATNSLEQQLHSPTSAPPPLKRQSSLPKFPDANAARMQAFAVATPSTYTSSSALGAIPKTSPGSSSSHSSAQGPGGYRNRKIESRQKMIEVLRNIEERIQSGADKKQPDVLDDTRRGGTTKCSCQRLSMHVLDISEAITSMKVTWLELPVSQSVGAPEETILYSLVLGREELVMFGGIQKDVSSITRAHSSNAHDTVSNAVYALHPLPYLQSS